MGAHYDIDSTQYNNTIRYETDPFEMDIPTIFPPSFTPQRIMAEIAQQTQSAMVSRANWLGLNGRKVLKVEVANSHGKIRIISQCEVIGMALIPKLNMAVAKVLKDFPNAKTGPAAKVMVGGAIDDDTLKDALLTVQQTPMDGAEKAATETLLTNIMDLPADFRKSLVPNATQSQTTSPDQGQ